VPPYTLSCMVQRCFAWRPACALHGRVREGEGGQTHFLMWKAKTLPRLSTIARHCADGANATAVKRPLCGRLLCVCTTVNSPSASALGCVLHMRPALPHPTPAPTVVASPQCCSSVEALSYTGT
jgi:hypothetical protein